MKNIQFIITFCLAINFLGCGNSDELKRKELELKEKELELKERELNKGRELTNDSITKAKNVTTQNIAPAVVEQKKAIPASIINSDKLLGKWFASGKDNVNLQLNRDGSFEFQDGELEGEDGIYLYGKYTITDKKLNLLYSDRPKQSFNIEVDKTGEYAISLRDYYFTR